MPDNPQAPEGIPRGNDTAQQHACDYGQYHPYEPSYHQPTHPSLHRQGIAYAGHITPSLQTRPQWAQGAQPWVHPSSYVPPAPYNNIPSLDQWPRDAHPVAIQHQSAVARDGAANIPVAHAVAAPRANASSTLVAPMQATLWGGVVTESIVPDFSDQRHAKRLRMEVITSQHPKAEVSDHFVHHCKPTTPLHPSRLPSGTQADPFLLESSPERTEVPPAKKKKNMHEHPALPKSHAAPQGQAHDYGLQDLQTVRARTPKATPTRPNAAPKSNVIASKQTHESGSQVPRATKARAPRTHTAQPTDAAKSHFVPPGQTYEYGSQQVRVVKARTPKLPAAKPTETAPSGEPPLCQEQADLVDLIMSRRNVFYTGSAGCGKSTVLKAFVKRFEERGIQVHILAPTGRAALAVNGTTTWSYVGWIPSHHKKPIDELLKGAHGKVVNKRLKDTRVLVIDEISMVENLHLERINAFMKEARNNGRAFGGVQVIVTGDFCQLPPVKPFQQCIHCGKDLAMNKAKREYTCKEHGTYHDKDKWAFRSKAWEECGFTHVNLTHIHRQNDKVFIDILQKLRIGQPLSVKDLDLLLNHETKGLTSNAVKLFGSRAEVNRVNLERFNLLRSQPRSFKCLDDFRWNEKHFSLENKGRVENGVLVELERNEHRYTSYVNLKKGMLVVLLANLDIKAGLVNGAQGTIQGFKPVDPSQLPKAARRIGKDGMPVNTPGLGLGRTLVGDYAEYREDQVQQFMKQCEHQVLPEVRFLNGQCLTIYPDCTVNELGDSKPYTTMARTQIPLMPGYAITTHKSQGMTLDKVEVDLSRTFEAGQAYVALSRARSLDGLRVVSFPREAQCGADSQVQDFLREHFPDAFPKPDPEQT